MKDSIPIALFVYKRINNLEAIIKNLSKSERHHITELYIFSDGAKDDCESKMVESVREYCRNISGFKEVIISESNENKGLANSIIDGVSSVLKKHEKIIVLEDDLVPSENFLEYMNNMLNKYENNKSIISICGFSKKCPTFLKPSSEYLALKRSSSWGWGTWKSKWEMIDFQKMNNLQGLNLMQAILKGFFVAPDLPIMYLNQKKGKIDSWAIRFVMFQVMNNMISIHPIRSLILNKGFSKNATNTDMLYGYDFEFDNSKAPKNKQALIIGNNLKLYKIYMWFYELKYMVVRSIKRLQKNHRPKMH